MKNPIFQIIDQNNLIELERLISEKVNLKVFDPSSYNDSPMHKAIRNNQKKIVELLIKNNFPLNIQNDFGNTPLHLAVIQNNIEIVETLLNAGAQIDIPNNNNQTVIDIAVEQKNYELINLIKKYI